MGEIADDCYDRMFDEMDRFGSGDWDEYDNHIPSYYGHRPVAKAAEVCLLCLMGGLDYTGTGKDRYLFKPGAGRHVCHSRFANDFDALPDDCSDLV